MNEEFDNLKFGYESALVHLHKIINRLIAVIVLLIILLVGSNIAWLVYESQFETVETTEENEVFALQSGDDNTVVGGDMIVNSNGSGVNKKDN